MSNPFALLDVDDPQTKRNNNKKTTGQTTLTPAQRKQQKDQKKAQQQQEAPQQDDSFNFVKVENDLSGFVDVKTRGTQSGEDKKLNKEEFLKRGDRADLIGKGGNQGGNKKGGNKGGNNQNRQNKGGNNQGQGQKRTNQNQGGNVQTQEKRPNTQKRGGNQGGNQGGKTYQEKKADKAVGAKKNDRKTRNPGGKTQGKNNAGGAFTWDDNRALKEIVEGEEPIDVVTPEEQPLEEIPVEESSDEWAHEEVMEQDPDKYKAKLAQLNPSVKRVGLSAYLATKDEEEARVRELQETLAGKQRTLDVVIPTDVNLNKKKKDDFIAVDDSDAFLFGNKQQKKKNNKTQTQTTSQTQVQLGFKIKNHRGFNQPRPPREEGKEGEEKGNRGRTQNRGPRNNNNNNRDGRNKGQNRNNNNRRGPKRPQIVAQDFPTLGGNVAPKEAKWPLQTSDE